MPRASHLLQDEGTLQAGRVTKSMILRSVSANRPIIIPQADPDDMEVIVSAGFTYQYSGIAEGRLLVLDGALVHVDMYHRVSYVERHGDSFALDYDSNLSSNYSRVRNITNQPDRLAPAGWARYGINQAALDNVILYHAHEYQNANTAASYDTFVALRLDPDTRTGNYEYEQRPTGSTNTVAGRTPHSKLVRLDGNTAALAGTTLVAGGYQGFLYMVEYDDGTGVMTGYGPTSFGAPAAEADAHRLGETWLIRIDHERLLVVWHTYFQNDNADMSSLAYQRPLHAQVFTYDTTAHTLIATGPVCTFRSGIEGFGDTGLHWYPESEVLVLVGLNYSTVGDYGEQATGFTDYDWHIAARSLLVQGYNVVEGQTHARIADKPVEDEFADHWYVQTLHGVGDRLMSVWCAAAEGVGGPLKYTKFKVTLTGVDRGAITVYDEDILIPGSGLSYENWPHGSGTAGQVALNDSENLGMFEHYLNDYDDTTYRFVLCREAT